MHSGRLTTVSHRRYSTWALVSSLQLVKFFLHNWTSQWSEEWNLRLVLVQYICPTYWTAISYRCLKLFLRNLCKYSLPILLTWKPHIIQKINSVSLQRFQSNHLHNTVSLKGQISSISRQTALNLAEFTLRWTVQFHRPQFNLQKALAHGP